VADFEARAIAPARELGAYEALWAREGTSVKSMAEMFRNAPGAVPSDLVRAGDARQYGHIAREALLASRITQYGIRVHGAGEYPSRLRDAQHPVPLLHFLGNWDLASSPAIAIIGTRRPSADGIRRATQLALACVDAGFTVVSGLARGIDTAAHLAAIDAGGRTIAVLGTPVTACYPKENLELQRQIARDFLLISQVPIVKHARQSWQRNRQFFRERNVTMSALTSATVVVEAGDTSGALIQARHALLQRRKLFLLDSCVRNPGLSWPAPLLERGAISVTGFDEIRVHLAV
jgi:DNA processing protein